MVRRKKFGKTWWTRRWLDVLEQFGWANRLSRGRSYARAGRVLEVDVDPGHVHARVQGRRPRPYTVHIEMPVLSDAQWNRVLDAMAERAVFMAKLLAGEMPQNIEEAFETAGVHLFPAHAGEIEMSCTCPDWAVPCKHIAATFYILGEMFDYDPFLLFLLRGRSKEDVIAALEERYTGKEIAPEIPDFPEQQPATLEGSLADYWGNPDAISTLTLRVSPPPVPDMMLRRLGDFPEQKMREIVYTTLSKAYEIVAERARAYRENGAINGEDER